MSRRKEPKGDFARELGLALGGGVARGIAHIGVLEVLEMEGIRPSYLAGTSSGSIVAALYASGMPIDKLKNIAETVSWTRLVRPVVPRLGLVDHRQLYHYLVEVLEGKTFEQLQLPLAVVATNLVSGDRMVLSSGDVAYAVTASCSIPGIFTPVPWGKSLLVDGGVADNVPARVARQMGADVVMAVSLNSGLAPSPKPANIFQVLLRSIEIMQAEKTEREWQDADLTVFPQVQHLSPIDLERAGDFMRAGRRAMENKLDDLKELLSARPGPLARLPGLEWLGRRLYMFARKNRH